MQVAYSTRTGRALVMPTARAELLRRGDLENLNDSTLSFLAENLILVRPDEDELRTIISENETLTLNDKSLYRVLMPTQNCQMACHYRGQSHEKNQMGPATER